MALSLPDDFSGALKLPLQLQAFELHVRCLVKLPALSQPPSTSIGKKIAPREISVCMGSSLAFYDSNIVATLTLAAVNN